MEATPVACLLPKPCHVSQVHIIKKWICAILFFNFLKNSLGGVKDKHLEQQTPVKGMK